MAFPWVQAIGFDGQAGGLCRFYKIGKAKGGYIILSAWRARRQFIINLHWNDNSTDQTPQNQETVRNTFEGNKRAGIANVIKRHGCEIGDPRRQVPPQGHSRP